MYTQPNVRPHRENGNSLSLFNVRFKHYSGTSLNGKYEVVEQNEIFGLTYEEVKNLETAFHSKKANKGLDWFEASLVIIDIF